MSESAEALANISSRRNLTIEITNYSSSYVFIDPKIHTESGHCHVPPAPTLIPMATDMCNFSKTSAKASGAVGLLSYDAVCIKGQPSRKGKLVIMYSVPYERNAYQNWFGLGIFNNDTTVDEALFKKMYYDKKQEGFKRAEACGSVCIFQGEELDVMATMSPLGRSIMKAEIWDKLFDSNRSQRPY